MVETFVPLLETQNGPPGLWASPQPLTRSGSVAVLTRSFSMYAAVEAAAQIRGDVHAARKTARTIPPWRKRPECGVILLLLIRSFSRSYTTGVSLQLRFYPAWIRKELAAG